jgi:hypothetical protein
LRHDDPRSDLFVRAGQALGSVVDQIDADQWELVTEAGLMAAGRAVRETVVSPITGDRRVGRVRAGGAGAARRRRTPEAARTDRPRLLTPRRRAGAQ